jgi:hypothetical protein
MISDDGRLFVGNAGEIVRRFARVAVVRTLVAVEHGESPDGEVRASLRVACEAARQHGFHAESLVILVKDSWHNLADTRLRQRREASFALNKLITMCIAEFYEADSTNQTDDRTSS